MNDLFDNWLYEKTDDNKARFVLGEKGENPLICMGVNPSTATPEKLDNTLRLVKARAKMLGYDGWIMLNLYPQRATDPNDLHTENEYNVDLDERNICHILRFIPRFATTITIWAAWGTLIEKRKYLKGCLEEIYYRLEQHKKLHTMGCHEFNWITIGKRSVKAHPHHPLYLPKDSKPEPFDVKEYLRILGVEK